MVTRIGGAVQFVLAGSEAVGSFAAAAGTIETGVGPVVCTTYGVLQLDQSYAGLRTLLTGQETHTFLNEGLTQAGLTQDQADNTELAANLGLGGTMIGTGLVKKGLKKVMAFFEKKAEQELTQVAEQEAKLLAENAKKAADAEKKIAEAEKAVQEQAEKVAQKAEKAAQQAEKAIVTKKLEELPANVQDAFKKYEQNGWKGNVSGQTPGTKAGKSYFNKDGQLPEIDSSGNPIKYKEFDINNKLSDVDRDAQRFIQGSDGSVYYTDSHFGESPSPTGLPAFVKIK